MSEPQFNLRCDGDSPSFDLAIKGGGIKDLGFLRRAICAIEALLNIPHIPTSPPAGYAVTSEDYASIRDLIMAALNTEKFLSDGAEAGELRDFIRETYGRDIIRTSFSPQLSRLKQDGAIKSNNGRWTIIAGHPS